MKKIKKLLMRAIPDRLFLCIIYYKAIGERLDLKNPQTFNGKLQWLKLYDRKPLYIKLVDKYEVKDYVAQIIGKEYIIPTLGVWDRFDDIDFAQLPNKFVLKCTHDSGGVIVVKDKKELDISVAREKIERRMSQNFYYSGREWPYKKVKRRIIAEEYLENRDSNELIDYKLMCFNGKVMCSFVCTERYSSEGLKVTFFDREWNRMPFERHYPASTQIIKKPQKYLEMIDLAEKMSKDIPFVRVDFYEVDDRIYFGEYTLYPGGGFEEFTPKEWDYKLGKWLELR